MTDLFSDKSILSIEKLDEHPNWCMYFDGAVNLHRNGIRAILISLVGAHFFMAVKLRFPYTNNIARSAVCIASLEVALDTDVKDLEVYNDPS